MKALEELTWKRPSEKHIKRVILFLIRCVEIATASVIPSFLGIVLVFLLLRINQMKKQLEMMQKTVQKYVTYIIEEDEEENRISRYAPLETKKSRFRDDAEKNELIQNVLSEIFP